MKRSGIAIQLSNLSGQEGGPCSRLNSEGHSTSFPLSTQTPELTEVERLFEC